MTYDAARDRVVLFGGMGAGSVRLSDTWEWDGQTWTRRFPVESPSTRFGHSMASDPVRRRAVLFGGSDATLLADTWSWDGDNWVRARHDGPPSSFHSGMVWDGARARIVLPG
jgi:hypothetical protein